MVTHPLPPAKDISVGSAAECEIRISEPGIAPTHALLSNGQSLMTITDRSNGAGVEVGGRRLRPGESVPFALGDVLLLGRIAMVVQDAAPRSGYLRLVRSHDYFEGQLEEECDRARHGGEPFGVVRFKFSSEQARHVEQAMTEHLHDPVIVAMYGAAEYEILLLNMTPERAHAACHRLKSHVAAVGCGDIRLGLACWPRDGRSPEALLAAAAIGPRHPPGDRESVVVSMGVSESLRQPLERIAATNSNVLIMGETGVGKEVLARQIHEMSPRKHLPVVCVNCAALPEALLESELFGSERGAFTGATDAKPGLLETADGGTVLLDEMGELPLRLQAKLLRAVEQRQVTRLGGIKPRTITGRFIAITNRDLELEVNCGRFRQDLYYRLNALSLVVPPLRERVAEIEPLVEAFLAEFARQNAKTRPQRLSRAALRLLQRYSWPGNIRELRNVIERAVIFCQSEVIDLDHLPMDRLERANAPTPRSASQPSAPAASAIYPVPSRVSLGAYANDPADAEWRPLGRLGSGLGESIAATERASIQRALEQSCWNQTHAARILGISRRALISRIERYQLPRPRKR